MLTHTHILLSLGIIRAIKAICLNDVGNNGLTFMENFKIHRNKFIHWCNFKFSFVSDHN